ncbi:hypothetical protein, partial [Streptomyces scabiei]|uniref:hypothetical protein n=1 Tax=Streptomyces scabiei TaxID=1930 RepID=UPI0029BDC7DC
MSTIWSFVDYTFAGSVFHLKSAVRQGAHRVHSDALEVISFGESAVADEGAGDAGEGEEVVGLAFVAS